jgi:hypothetical protein
MLDYLFKENSDIRNQIATIMEYLETTFFEVDLKNKKFNYDYDRKSSFLYLNVLQDLLRVDKKNNDVGIRLREWFVGHPLISPTKTDQNSVNSSLKSKNPSLFGQINLERENWDTVMDKLKNEQ